MTTYTTHYNLDKYEETDPANLADQYNSAMDKVDAQLYAEAGASSANANAITALNQQLASTNTELAAVKTDVGGNAASITALQGGLTSLEETVAANKNAADNSFTTAFGEIQTTNNALQQTNAELDAVKTDVDKNTPLVEEHVNYFAALGVTDDQSANDLHTQIDNTYQGVMSNTQEIKTLEEVAANNDDYIKYDCTTEGFSYLHLAINKNNNIFKLYGQSQLSTGTATRNRTLIPGMIINGNQYYGIKLDFPAHLPEQSTFREVSCVGLEVRGSTLTFNQIWQRGFSIGTDGNIYLYASTTQDPIQFPSPYLLIYFQCPLYLDNSPWPVPREEIEG